MEPEVSITRGEADKSYPSDPEENGQRLFARVGSGRSIWFVLTMAAIVAGVAVVLWTASHGRHNSIVAAGSPDRNTHERNGPDSSVRLKGTTAAVQSRIILVPVISAEESGTLTLTHLAQAGSHVHRGDILAEFDRQAQTRAFFDKQAEYEKFQDQVVEEQAKEITARAKDETELQDAEDGLKKAELEMQKVELLSRIEAEKNRETLDAAKATADQLRQTFELKRKAARAGIQILEIQRDRAQQTMMHLQANADLMVIHAPIDGVVVLETIWKEGQFGEVQEGDQLRPGVPFMRVVDPSAMEVDVLANQEDFFRLQVGQSATIHLDAYPDLSLHGKLEQIAPVARYGDFSSKMRNFAVVFSIEGTDARLMPDLSASVDVNLAAMPARAGGAP